MYLPGCSGTGCGTPQGASCAFCVSDMAACSKEYGASACQSTYNARAAQGVYGCSTQKPAVQVFKLEADAELGCMCFYGNKMNNCAHSPFPNDDRCVCGDSQSDWKTPAQCQAPTPQPTPQPSNDHGCTMTAVGQKSMYLPGCSGTGCGTPQGSSCAFCVSDMTACTKEYGAGACQSTYNARAAQGVYGCSSAMQQASSEVIMV